MSVLTAEYSTVWLWLGLYITFSICTNLRGISDNDSDSGGGGGGGGGGGNSAPYLCCAEYKIRQ